MTLDGQVNAIFRTTPHRKTDSMRELLDCFDRSGSEACHSEAFLPFIVSRTDGHLSSRSSALALNTSLDMSKDVVRHY